MGFWYTLNFQKIPLFFSVIKRGTFTVNIRTRMFVKYNFPLKILRYLQFCSLPFGEVFPDIS